MACAAAIVAILCAMLAAIHSAAILGIDAYDVTVEVDAARGLRRGPSSASPPAP